MTFASLAFAVWVAAGPALAQAPPPSNPAPAVRPVSQPSLAGNVSFGLGITSGNRETVNFNAGYEVRYAPSTRNVVKSTGLFLYGKTDGQLSNEQYGFSARDEYTPGSRPFLFSEVRYLHDRFKGIDYLLSPTAGVGYKIVDRPRGTLFVSSGIGGAWEQDYNSGLRKSGAVTVDQKLTIKLTPTATVGQSVFALWNITDIHDGLYVFRANLSAGLAGKMHLKVELADTYKTKLTPATLRNNDIAVIVGVVYKF
jgi:putative salt-induced outer membrane protein YdiY